MDRVDRTPCETDYSTEAKPHTVGVHRRVTVRDVLHADTVSVYTSLAIHSPL